MSNILSMVTKRKNYGTYITKIQGKDYAMVNLPMGGGKYKQKCRLLDSIPGGSNKIKAAQWAGEQLEKHQSGITGVGKTVTDLAKWYIDKYVIAPMYQDGKKMYGMRTWKARRDVLNRMLVPLGHLRLDKLDIDTFVRYKRNRLAEVSITTVNRELSIFRAMLRKAKSRKWISDNPFDDHENLIESALETKRTSPLTRRIAVRLLARSRKSQQPLLHYLIFILMSTGARPSEVFPFSADDTDGVPREPLTWKSLVDSNFKTLTLVSYKDRIRHERLVPASVQLEKAMRELHTKVSPKDDDVIFPIKGFKRSWKTLLKSARVSGVWIRDFRHYYNTQLMQRSDINDLERMLLMGHTNIKMNARYAKIGGDFIEKYRNTT